MFSFPPHDYSYVNVSDPYIGVNIISPWVYLLFFTWWSLILYSAWLILFGLSNIFNWKIKVHLANKYLIAAVTAYQVFICLMYTGVEVFTGFKLDWYAHNFHSWFSVAENIFIHYIFVAFSVYVWFSIKLESIIKIKKVLILLIFPLLYFTFTIIAFRYLLPIE